MWEQDLQNDRGHLDRKCQSANAIFIAIIERACVAVCKLSCITTYEMPNPGAQGTQFLHSDLFLCTNLIWICEVTISTS